MSRKSRYKIIEFSLITLGGCFGIISINRFLADPRYSLTTERIFNINFIFFIGLMLNCFLFHFLYEYYNQYQLRENIIKDFFYRYIFPFILTMLDIILYAYWNVFPIFYISSLMIDAFDFYVVFLWAFYFLMIRSTNYSKLIN
jgi:hypothetical protein